MGKKRCTLTQERNDHLMELYSLAIADLKEELGDFYEKVISNKLVVDKIRSYERSKIFMSDSGILQGLSEAFSRNNKLDEIKKKHVHSK